MNKYNKKKEKIGKRIKEQREGKGLSKEQFLLALSKSEQSHKSVTAWEDGKRLPNLDTLVDMTGPELFDCDVGYLLCDYNEKRYYTADVSEQTGLSIEAVEQIDKMNRHSLIPIDVLSSILTHPDIEGLLHMIYELAQIKNARARVAATQESSKQSGAYADSIKAQRAMYDVVEKGESKIHRISVLFDNIAEKIADQLSYTPDVSKKGADIAKRVLNPEEWLMYLKNIDGMIDKTFPNGDKQNS